MYKSPLSTDKGPFMLVLYMKIAANYMWPLFLKLICTALQQPLLYRNQADRQY